MIRHHTPDAGSHRGRRVRLPRRDHRDRRGLVDAAGMGGLQAAPRRWRHVVLRGGRAAPGSAWTSSAATCRSTQSRPICSTPSSPSRITASITTSASTRSVSAARVWRDVRRGNRARRWKHAHAAARAHAVPVEQAHAGAQGAGSRARAAARAGAVEEADPRAVSQSHLSERRRLRRRDDVAQPVRKAGAAA